MIGQNIIHIIIGTPVLAIVIQENNPSNHNLKKQKSKNWHDHDHGRPQKQKIRLRLMVMVMVHLQVHAIETMLHVQVRALLMIISRVDCYQTLPRGKEVQVHILSTLHGSITSRVNHSLNLNLDLNRKLVRLGEES